MVQSHEDGHAGVDGRSYTALRGSQASVVKAGVDAERVRTLRMYLHHWCWDDAG